MPYDSSGTLVFGHQKSRRNSNGVPHVTPGQSSLIPLFPQFFYLLLCFTFPFFLLTCLVYFVAFPSFPILPGQMS